MHTERAAAFDMPDPYADEGPIAMPLSTQAEATLAVGPGVFERTDITTYLSRVTAPRHLRLVVSRPSAVDLAQEAGLPISNLTEIKRYNKARPRFLLEQAQRGDTFALNALCRNAIARIIKQADYYLDCLEAATWVGAHPSERDDLIQTGLIEVPKVAERFEINDGSSFYMFLGQRVGLSFVDYAREISSDFGVSRRKYAMLRQAVEKGAPKEKAAKLHDVTQNGFPEAPQYLDVEGRISVVSISLENVMTEAVKEAEFRSYSDGEVQTDDELDPSVLRPELISYRDIEQQEASMDAEELYGYLNRLPERQRSILVAYYGLFGGEGMTLGGVAELEGVTESRISQIHTKAVENLRRLMQGVPAEGEREPRLKLGRLPRQPGPKALEVLAERLSEYAEAKLTTTNIEQILENLPQWQAEHSYDGAERRTLLKRDLPASIDAGSYLRLVFGDGEQARYGIKGGVLHVRLTDVTGKNMQAILQAEILLTKTAKPHLNEEALDKLSPQEVKIVGNLFKTHQEIALELGISQSTVRTHIHNICKRLSLKPVVADLAIFAARNGLIDLDDLPSNHTMAGLSRMQRTLAAEYCTASYEEAAEGLALSVSTIRTHWHNVYHKTGAANRTQVALLAIRDGLIPMKEVPEEMDHV